MSGPRRFIAGAICPACHKIDKLVVYAEDGANICECVSCGFRDIKPGSVQPGSEEHGRGLGESESGAEQRVRIVDPRRS